MPTYGYRCTHCNHSLDIFQKISDLPLRECTECHHETLVRGPGGGIGLSFQGSGFYINDYPRDGGKSCESSPSSGCCPCKDVK